DRAGQLRVRLLGLCDQRDVRAVGGGTQRDRLADAAAAAGHDDGLSCERIHFGLLVDQYDLGSPRLCWATKFSTISRLTGAIRPTRTAPSRVPRPYSEASPLPPCTCTAWSTARIATSAAAYF